MVVFTCPDCNTSIKKNKVEEHFSRRKCSTNYVTCIDCLKDFHDDDFKSHNTCVSEAVKYGASGTTSTTSASASKTLSWQQQAVENLQNSMEDCKNKQLFPILEFLSAQPNLSRKKGKFVNICQNVFKTCKKDPSLAEEAWRIADTTPEAVKLDVAVDNETASTGSACKRPSAENSEDEEIAQVRAKKAKKLKQKKENVERLNDTLDPADVHHQETLDKSGKFDWRNNIFSLVAKKGEISLKKLQKKMTMLFLEAEQRPCHEDKFIKKFYTKLNSMKDIRVDGTTVYVIEDEEDGQTD